MHFLFKYVSVIRKNRKVCARIDKKEFSYYISSSILNEIRICANSSAVNFFFAVPLQAWSGPEGSRKLRFPDFMTTAQKGDKVVSLRYRPHLPPGNPPGTHFC